MKPLIDLDARIALLANGLHRKDPRPGADLDPHPVVKLFTPDAGATWLLTELDPDRPHLAFGLCDLGLGSPELGYVWLTELSQVRGRFGLPIERDLHFKAAHPLSAYVTAAQRAGRIVTDLAS